MDFPTIMKFEEDPMKSKYKPKTVDILTDCSKQNAVESSKVGRGRTYHSLEDTETSPLTGSPLKRITCGFRGIDDIPVNVSTAERIALPVKDYS